jgi:hypothetical protein
MVDCQIIFGGQFSVNNFPITIQQKAGWIAGFFVVVLYLFSCWCELVARTFPFCLNFKNANAKAQKPIIYGTSYKLPPARQKQAASGNQQLTTNLSVPGSLPR